LGEEILGFCYPAFYGVGADERQKQGQLQILRLRYAAVRTTDIENSFALVKRGIIGVYHNVSKEYLHRYLWQFDFMWNGRKLNDGERTILTVKSAEGKRLTYNAAPNRHV
jgi:hypothetical protein